MEEDGKEISERNHPHPIVPVPGASRQNLSCLNGRRLECSAVHTNPFEIIHTSEGDKLATLATCRLGKGKTKVVLQPNSASVTSFSMELSPILAVSASGCIVCLDCRYFNPPTFEAVIG